MELEVSQSVKALVNGTGKLIEVDRHYRFGAKDWEQHGYLVEISWLLPVTGNVKATVILWKGEAIWVQRSK
jgi:hypothetical protein